jgi:hypothetical protein
VHVPSAFARVKQLVFFALLLTVSPLEMWYYVLTPHTYVASSVASPTPLPHTCYLVFPSRCVCCPCSRPHLELGMSKFFFFIRWTCKNGTKTTSCVHDICPSSVWRTLVLNRTRAWRTLFSSGSKRSARPRATNVCNSRLLSCCSIRPKHTIGTHPKQVQSRCKAQCVFERFTSFQAALCSA